MDWDFVIVGSGFGGSVSALRLSEKGYRVLVLEKGRRLQAADFPKTNWDLKKWMWMPQLGFRGLFKMSFLPHVTVLHGVGVGGGSLVYANTLPVPKSEFFNQGQWAGLADWEDELRPHYKTALRMLGAAKNPYTTLADNVFQDIGKDMGRALSFEPATVAVYFGEAGKTVSDPFFDGEGPDRTGCIQCGACMTGCRFGAKNTLDKNYLWLAEKHGAEIRPNCEVIWVSPSVSPRDGGYTLRVKEGDSFFGRKTTEIRAKHVIFAGGVMGTLPLLLKLAASPEGLPKLSPRLGDYVRTNSEAILGVVGTDASRDMSRGIAISSILHTDDHSHAEPVRYGAGSGFFRLMAVPHATGSNVFVRLLKTAGVFVKHPLKFLRTLVVRDWAKSTLILLYMRTVDGHLRMRLGLGDRLVTKLADGPAPTPFIPEATDLVNRIADKIDGYPQGLATELLLGVPTTAHILGGCVIGATAESGVIDAQQRVHGYDGLWICDGSAMSSNPGVNPSLTITAMTERAMGLIPMKGEVRALPQGSVIPSLQGADAHARSVAETTLRSAR